MYQEFESLLGELLVKLNDCLQNQEASNHSEVKKQAYFLQAKSSLIELCLKKLVQYLEIGENPVALIA